MPEEETGMEMGSGSGSGSGPGADRDITTIDDVLDELDAIVETAIAEDSPLGIFAYVYRRTTSKVAEAIGQGRFEDAERMERFDVAFARLYINAFHRHRAGKPVAYAWEVAFNAAGKPDCDAIIMQHLLLGMNAHINLDLGMAAAEIAPGRQIRTLENDFMLVNELLAELVDEVQQRIGRVSPLMFLLDWIGERTDEAVVNFSIEKARGYAWKCAQNLAHAEPGERGDMISEIDEEIAGLGNLVAHPPGFLLPNVLSVIRLFEVKHVGEVIERLRA
ncbi:MAG: DUF5995 family protein [Balneolaceae bacterium]|nr:DUF5995 family protein [Balneolaceae bacterium]